METQKQKYSREYYKKNKEKKKLYSKNYDILNKDKQKEYHKQHQLLNKDSLEKYQKSYYKENYQKIKEKNQSRKDEIKEYRKNYMIEKRKNNSLFNLKHNLGNMIYKSLYSQGYSKKSRTYQILGCSFEEFKLYLESKFESWMDWRNKGLYNGTPNFGWDIDHIIPLSSATNEEEIIKLNHYSNLQPLCSYINRDIKRDNIYYSGEKLGLKQERI
jgi:hypothetical protein